MGEVQIIPPQGGGGVTPNLQKVTDVGNTTTNDIKVTDGTNTIIELNRALGRITVLNPPQTIFSRLEPNMLTLMAVGGRGGASVTHAVQTGTDGTSAVTWRVNASGVGALLSDITRQLLASTVLNGPLGLIQNADQLVLFFGSTGDIARLPAPATGNTKFSFQVKNMNTVGAITVDVAGGANIDNGSSVVIAALGCYTFWCSGGQYYIISR